MLSLRRRAIIGGAVTLVLSIVIGMFALSSFIDGKTLERFDEGLNDRHTQIVVALSSSEGDPAKLAANLFDPAYGTPLSGRYWQVSGSEGQLYTSDSLIDQVVTVLNGEVEGTFTIGAAQGPYGEAVRAAHQKITLEGGATWEVIAANDISRLTAERERTLRSLLLAFALIGMLALAGAIIQTTAILQPIEKLRRDVANRWDREEELRPRDYPEEVSPLVEDINELMTRNKEIVDRARRQAADLAHALKTPSAILRNELSTLVGDAERIQSATDALDRLDAQLGRSLARMRAANSAASVHHRTDLTVSIGRFVRLFGQMAEREGKVIESDVSKDLIIRLDKQDIEEVLGNVLDNALKHCISIVKISAYLKDERVEIVIEDDGPGIPQASQREALRAGGRLDQSKPGTGLGLAIAVDLLHAYGAKLDLSDSQELGGLAVNISIPANMGLKVA